MRTGIGIFATCVATLAIAACSGGDEAAPSDANEAVGSGPVEEAPSVPLVGPNGEILGEVSAGDADTGAQLKITARGLPPGEHGLHIHQVGLCEGPKFESAQGHWNPEGKQHGLQNPQGPHRGDLPNVTVGADGVLNATVTVEGSHLAGSRAHGFGNIILDEDGAALVMHAGPDDMTTDPSGDSGDRIACAVLGSGQPSAAGE